MLGPLRAAPPRAPRAAWTGRAPLVLGLLLPLLHGANQGRGRCPRGGEVQRPSQPRQVTVSHAGGRTQTFATAACGPQRQPAAETTKRALLAPGPQQSPSAVLPGWQPRPETCQSHRHLGSKAPLCRCRICPGTDGRWFWCRLPLPQASPPRGSAPAAVGQHRSRSCHTRPSLCSSDRHCPAGENTRELSPSGSTRTSRPHFVLVRGICNAAEMEEVKKADAE